MTKRYNIQFKGLESVNSIKGQYLLLSNHVHFWDPFFISYNLRKHIYYVASDEYFRIFPLNIALKYFGAIPKTKFMSDSDTVRKILQVKQQGKCIGIFPEGLRSWDGEVSPIVESTYKLIKHLKIPVVMTTIKGGALSYPRWARYSKKGLIEVEYRIIMDSNFDFRDINKVREVINEKFSYSEYSWQEKNMIPFIGKKLALYIELFLFICPQCKSIASIKSFDNKFKCKQCNTEFYYTKYGYIKNSIYNTPAKWNIWQKKYLRKKIKDLIYYEKSEKVYLFYDKGVSHYQGVKAKSLKKVNLGQLFYTRKGVVLKTLLRGEFLYDFEKINGINVQSNNKFEFYYDGILQRFAFKGNIVSAYKWTISLKIIKEIIWEQMNGN